MNFLPLLPIEQNRLLFGSKCPEKPRTMDPYHDFIARDSIASLTGDKPEEWGFVPTSTRLPDLSSYKGPKEALETLLTQRWGKYLTGLKELLTTPPVKPLESPLILPNWTHYPHDGQPRAVPHPPDDVLLFDTETYVKGGNHPVIGVAYGASGWSIWLHPQITQGFPPTMFRPMLIPLGPTKLVIAHNVMFDLSKVEESYSLSNAERHVGVCTMSWHGTISAMGGDQVLRAYKAMKGKASLPWMSQVCQDSLKECLKFHCGREISKDERDTFVKGTIGDIVEQLPSLLKYAVNDVHELHYLAMVLYPKFKLQCPSVITLCGLMELSRSLLVVKSNYEMVVRANDIQLAVAQRQLEEALLEEADKLVQDFTGDPSDYENDPWLSQLDWTPAKSGKNKGKPAWARKKITTGGNAAPLIMRMTWNGQPLVFDKDRKWGWVNEGKWQRLPHPDGNKNVGSPLSKHFGQFFESGVLGCKSENNLPKAISRLSYWVSYQSRFQDQYLAEVTESRKGIVPSTKLIGTLTGRQVEKTWLTAAQCKPGKLGSDFFHIIQPPSGWDMILWDEDTEEVRIAALWGDFRNGKIIGSTPMSQIAFMGDKDLGTDAHSVTATLAGIDRQQAKIANFRDIFGGGRKTQTDALRTAHPDWTDQQLDGVVSKILDAKRGTKNWGEGYSGGTDSQYHNQAAILAETLDFRLPSTGRMIPNVINPRYDTQKAFYTSRYNAPVQGTGADILHATAACVPIVAGMFGIPESDFGYVMARHDEIGYNTLTQHSDNFAEVANAAHCWAWAIFLEGLDMPWMPTPLARLSSINVDWVYRKEVNMPVDAGYGMGFEGPDGRSIK